MWRVRWTPLLGAVFMSVYIELGLLPNYNPIAQVYATHAKMAVVLAF